MPDEKIRVKIGDQESLAEEASEHAGMGKEEHDAHMQAMMAGIDSAIAALEAGDMDSALGLLKGLRGEEQKEAAVESEEEQPERRESLRGAIQGGY